MLMPQDFEVLILILTLVEGQYFSQCVVPKHLRFQRVGL